MYSYSDHSIWVINSLYRNFTDLYLSVEVRNISGDMVWATSKTITTLCEDCPLEVLRLPHLWTTTVFFLRLSIVGRDINTTINDYWLSTVPDVLDWSNSTFYTTFCTSYADYSDLQTLAPVSLTLTSEDLSAGSHKVTIANPTTTIAFFIRLRAVRGGKEVLPALWDDNYITLFAGEARVVAVRLLDGLSNVNFTYEVWNNISGKV
jgi:exo-1,4-beta-D-glucosaminidase